MSQHTDWRPGKIDMGVLWPFDEINDAAFSREPIPELDFVQRDDYINLLDDQGTIWDEVDGWDNEQELCANPEYGEDTPTHDDDDDPDNVIVLDVEEVQRLLAKKGYSVIIDGRPGPKTRAAVRRFQQDWNKKNPNDQIKVDGITGPETSARLQKG